MIKIFKKFFRFSGEHRRAWYLSVVLEFLRCIAEAIQFFPLFLVLLHLVDGTMTPAVAWTALGLVALSVALQAVLHYFSHKLEMRACYLMLDDKRISIGERTVIDDVSLSIPERTSCAIVGPSGSGKTTLVNLMARFWDVDAGTVSLGGEDVRDWKLDELMAHFAMVFQDVYLFNDTIENNIKFGRPDATHEQVVAAARAARCHDFVEALPEGYATMLGEGGATVSGGEKQRISIARALLKDAPIVLLDEATANVDPENEDELQAAIEELTRRKTVVMIAHRLKTVRHADQILVLDGGRIVQRGTHDELMAEGGIYEDFVRMREKALGWKVGAA